MPSVELPQLEIKNPSAEEILSLKPDVVFIYNWGKAEMVDNLRELGIKVVVEKDIKVLLMLRRM